MGAAMSHDAWMEIDTGGPEPARVAEIGNYTRNVSPMWRKAMTHAAGREMWIDDTDGMTGEEAAPLFTTALGHMIRHPSEYEPLNPDNGWGSYEGAKEFMVRCAEACIRHPKATMRWSV
jgi:hypothetical protein